MILKSKKYVSRQIDPALQEHQTETRRAGLVDFPGVVSKGATLENAVLELRVPLDFDQIDSVQLRPQQQQLSTEPATIATQSPLSLKHTSRTT